MSLTVRRALELPVVRRGVPEVVAGAESLDRLIRWVHAAEVQNIATLLRGGELLLTTGMGLSSDAARQLGMVRDLARRDVAGLVLELGTTFDAVPPALVEGCAETGLPLVVLHRPLPFVDVTEAIHAEIINAQFSVMQRGEELHQRFTELLLQGADVTEVLAAVAETTGNPVLLRRPDGDVIATALNGHQQADVAAAGDAAGRGLSGTPDRLERSVPSGDPDRPNGMLVLLALGQPLGEFSAVALERAAALVGLALQRDRGERSVAHLERGAFLADVLQREVREADAVARAAAFGVHTRTLLPIAIGRRAPRLGRLTGAEDARWAQVWGDVRRALDAQRIPAILGHLGDDALLAVGRRPDGDRVELAGRVAELVRGAAQRRIGSPGSAVICVGADASTWAGFANAAEPAMAALPAAAAVRGRAWHDVAVPDVELLFAGLRDVPTVRAFAAERLAPVVAHDAQRAAKLLPTLEVLCRHGGHKAAAARELQLERRSLYHRIARLETLLGASLSDPETLLGLQVAMRMRPHLDAATGGGWHEVSPTAPG